MFFIKQTFGIDCSCFLEHFLPDQAIISSFRRGHCE